jgi:hypothetical protein
MVLANGEAVGEGSNEGEIGQAAAGVAHIDCIAERHTSCGNSTPLVQRIGNPQL